MPLNRETTPELWQPDIDRSVAAYNAWYLREAPGMWAQARARAVAEAESAMRVSNDFRTFTPTALKKHPAALFVGRMAISPPMARDRFVEFAGVSKSLVTKMEREGAFPQRIANLDQQLGQICAYLHPLFDPELFSWVEEGRAPDSTERDRALLVLGERLALAFYNPAHRNEQEARQKKLMREFLEKNGLEESTAVAFKMNPGTYAFGRNVPVIRADGVAQNLPVDCVVAPLDDSLPLACVELKSAGDYTNVNKRRKEESDKHEALNRKYGDDAIFLLQLFGYFGPAYLSFEASAGIDWAWDHRLKDIAPYFGLDL